MFKSDENNWIRNSKHSHSDLDVNIFQRQELERRQSENMSATSGEHFLNQIIRPTGSWVVCKNNGTVGIYKCVCK